MSPVAASSGFLDTTSLSQGESDTIEVLHCEHENNDPAESLVIALPSHTNISVDLPQSSLVTPRSHYDGFIPPAPLARERAALAELMKTLEGQDEDQDFIEFDLDQFAFYVNSDMYPLEMRPLHNLATKNGHGSLYFDGIVSHGDLRFYLKKVEVIRLPIGNYGVSNHSVAGHIWAQSRRNAQREIYYKLRKPAIEYSRYHTPFLWVADLAKHVVDFCSWMLDKKKQISLSAFQEQFIRWALKVHSTSPSFQQWRQKHNNDDFRTSVVANIGFIWKEMHGVLDARKVVALPLFKETMHFSLWKPEIVPSALTIREGKYEEHVTIVTPYIMECFGHMVLGKILRVGGPGAEEASLKAKERSRKPAAQPCIVARTGTELRAASAHPAFLPQDQIDLIKVGDTISTPRDGEDVTDTKWERMSSKDGVEDDRWFGLVQKIHVSKNGSKSFDVTWFYRPVETPCCMMRYPWPNELFLSDHCTCEESPSSRVKAREVLDTHSVDWFGDPERPQGEFVVRQIYIVAKRRWVTLSQSHLRCKHDSPPPFPFKVGDTVLVSCKAAEAEPESLLEAYELVKTFKQDQQRFVRLRRLLRRKDIDSHARDAAPNELVYTERLVVKNASRIEGKCWVRFFKPGAAIPMPYNRGGTGNMFFITTQLNTSNNGVRCDPFDGEFPNTLRQGFDPDSSIRMPKLRGLDLFCGSGNFGRGLEEGGAVEMRWANDIWDKAIHTYMANCQTPETTRPFLGSVDDLLQLAMEGKFTDNVPRPGDVDLIAGGSPCPGFSLLTVDKTTLRQVKNQSLVASFASFVDFYRPQYGILENVCTIVQSKQNRKQDVLSQLFCAIVGMGYQAQLVMVDAWSHGAPQSRSRVFLYFAAPGLSLPEAPRPSHSHFPNVKNHALGKMCNGEPFVKRIFSSTPFTYVSAAEGTADLPPIFDATPDSCIPFPDHRLSIGVTRERRREFALIPTHPSGLGFAKTWDEGRGVMTPAEREMFPPEGAERVAPLATGWTRVRPNDIFGTVTTSCNPTDARLSAGLHWAEDRPISIQEVRRAQGFPDEEVLLGIRRQQWKLVGNSVARQVAIALGLQLREAWLGSLYDDSRNGNKICIATDVPTPREFTPATLVSSSSAGTPRSGSSRGKKRALTSLLNEIHARQTKRRYRDDFELPAPTGDYLDEERAAAMAITNGDYLDDKSAAMMATTNGGSFDDKSAAAMATTTGESFDDERFALRGFDQGNYVDGESSVAMVTTSGESFDEEIFAPRGFDVGNYVDEEHSLSMGLDSDMDEMIAGMDRPIDSAGDVETSEEPADKINGLTIVRL